MNHLAPTATIALFIFLKLFLRRRERIRNSDSSNCDTSQQLDSSSESGDSDLSPSPPTGESQQLDSISDSGDSDPRPFPPPIVESQQLDSISDSVDPDPRPSPPPIVESQQLDSISDSGDSDPRPFPIREPQQLDSISESGDSDLRPFPISEYEVFLSFRGPDTRFNITDILYRFLTRSKIRTFRDDNELRKGEAMWPDLVKVIGQSTISVVIFSPGYAESKWCLKELVEIIEHQKREKRHVILPIFYLVKPGDVRNQTGPYRSAFQQHRNNFDEEIIQRWKAALNEVGSLKGWHIKAKDEATYVADVVSEVVLSHLIKNDNTLVTDESVGIDDHVESQQLDSISDSRDSDPRPFPIREPQQLDSISESGDSDLRLFPIGEYEVFMSFRGVDTRFNITDILYRFLTRSKIRTFRDDDELRKGEAIWPYLVKAIGQSTISVVIFSPGYAESKWCLKELVEIIEHQKREKRHVILPIFYLVEPEDVRNQTGPYQSAFQQHKGNNVDEDTIQSWEDALNEVGSLNGWHIKAKDEVADVADVVSEAVWSHLINNNNTLETNELVGIDDRVDQVVDMLDLGYEGVNLVGIHGMGGVGKTTLATAVYDKVSAYFDFDRYCFVKDIRETQKEKDGVLILQKEFISNILGKDFVRSVIEAKKIIRERVTQLKILVVLDDVDENFDFKEVLGDPNTFASGSCFIITSRNKEVLMRLSESQNQLYEVQEMDHGHSLKLFYKHAFKNDFPEPGFEALSEDIVSIVGGCPLILKTIGSLLYVEEKDVWEAKLEELRGTAPMDVDWLKISYEELTSEEQHIFLDIACFFIGIDKEIASYMWSDCNFEPDRSIFVLSRRSMVKIGNCNEFQMNDQLRDMGRVIVHQENKEYPGNRSRIWSNEEAADLLLRNKGTDQVQAIKVSSSSSDVWKLGSETFTNLPELRYFHAKGREMIVDFNHVLPNLKWLELEASQINNFNMKNLIIFAVHGLEHDSGIKEANKLKVLNLHGCSELSKLPEFPESGSLEMLHIDRFENRRENLEIGKLHNLKSLKLQHCKLGKILGGTIGMMEGLTEFHVSVDFKCDYDSFQQAIVDIGELSSLQVLNVNSPHLVDVLQGIKLPKRLKFLHTASGFDNLDELSDLEDLTVSETRMRLVIPRNIMHDKLKSMMLYSMEGIYMGESEGIILPSSLTRLHFRCLKSEKLPNLMDLGNLTELKLKECHDLQEIQGLGGLKSLQMLVIDAAGKLTRIEGLGDLMSSTNCRLKELQITDCHLLRTLLYEQHDERERDSVRVESLLSFRIKGGRLLDGNSIPKLSKFPRLKELEIGEISLNIDSTESASQQHQLLEGLENLEELVHLKVHNLPKVQRLPSLSKLRKVGSLALEDLPSLRKIEGLGELKSLGSIEVRRCILLESFPVAVDLPYYYLMSRITLDLRGCKESTHWNADLAPLVNLELPKPTIHWPHERLPWSMVP